MYIKTDLNKGRKIRNISRKCGSLRIQMMKDTRKGKMRKLRLILEKGRTSRTEV